MRDSLFWRLLGAQLLVIGIAVLASAVMMTDLATRAFMAIMSRYHIEPVMVEAEFLAATHRILIASSLAAVGAAALLGWLLVRRLVRPLERMMALAECIAQGDYACRVNPAGPEEIVRLAGALNRMAEGLQRVERLRRDLVANVAHELRTPLSTLQGYLEALREGVAPADARTFTSLHEEVLRLVRIVDSLHQLSQFDARASGPRLAEVDLPALVEGLLADYGPAFCGRGMIAYAVHDAPALRVQADADLVRQALRNLLDNAIRYAPDRAEVLVTTARENGTGVRIAVQNTGSDISPEDLPHVFERFYRGEKSRSRATGGEGIGLALVHEIALAHGGGTGAGSANGVTTVWFSLALRPAAAKAPAPQAGPAGVPRAEDRGASWVADGVARTP